MWSVNISFVFGFMVGFEFFDPQETEGITGCCFDLGILRILVLKDTEE